MRLQRGLRFLWLVLSAVQCGAVRCSAVHGWYRSCNGSSATQRRCLQQCTDTGDNVRLAVLWVHSTPAGSTACRRTRGSSRCCGRMKWRRNAAVLRVASGIVLCCTCAVSRTCKSRTATNPKRLNALVDRTRNANGSNALHCTVLNRFDHSAIIWRRFASMSQR